MISQSIAAYEQLPERQLPQSLTSLETYGFGLTGHLIWISTAPAMHIALGPQAIFVWIPAVIIGIMLNLQVKQLGISWQNVSGGTPNYTTRLLENHPGLGRFAAIAYFFSWALIPPLNAIILTDLIEANLEMLGLGCPEMLLRTGLTVIAFIVALGGTRALGILHSFFVIPAAGLLLLFSAQGLGWLVISPDSPGLMPTHWGSFDLVEWSKWFFFAVYATYACETSSSFIADSRKRTKTLNFLSWAAWLIPVIYMGGSWVLMLLDTAPISDSNTYAHLLATAQPFWGPYTSFFVTLLISSGCLLSCATAFSNAPRVLYQLARDGYISPVFAVVSNQGVLAPGLILTVLISVLFLAWGDAAQLIVVGSSAYMVPIMALHLGLWLQRHRPESRWGWWSFGFLIMEVMVLLLGGLAWSWTDVLIGLLAAGVVIGVDSLIRQVNFPPFHPSFWLRKHPKNLFKNEFKDFVLFQVLVLIVLVCGSTTVGWLLSKLGRGASGLGNNLLIVALMIISFVAIAIACWTSLPQVASIAAAREHAEGLFITALDTVPDTILVLDKNGIICQANPAAEKLFQVREDKLLNRPLRQFFPFLKLPPDRWETHSEQVLSQQQGQHQIIDTTISPRSRHESAEYIAILRDISDRKQAEADLRDALQQKAELAATATAQAKKLEETLQDLRSAQAQLIQTEKMSSLGQLVAGVAHEINNPVNFIHGNLVHVGEYTNDFLSLIELYQQEYPNPTDVIEDYIDEIDLEFLMADLPRTLSSMKVGTERIRQIVLTLRNFSRLDEAEMKPVDIHEGIDSTLLILQNRLKKKSDRPPIEIIKQYSNLPEVECYAGQLNQVFMNLISNAIDELHKGNKDRTLQDLQFNPSQITISTHVVDPDWIDICIKDNGSGMSAKVQQQIFDPFFTTKPIGQGTGLGLSISYQIVKEKHGGFLKCLSEPGVGTEFWIQIPVRQAVFAQSA